MENSIELNLRELIAVIIRRLWLIVLSAVVVGAMAYVYTAKFVTPLYRASITLYVSNSTYGEKQNITSNDQTAAQKLVADYSNVIGSQSFLEKVSQVVDNKVSAEAIGESMTHKGSSNSVILTVTISNKDPKMAKKLADTIADLALVEVPKIVEGSSARVVDYAKVPANPYSPSYTKNVTLGACIGAMLIIIVLVIQVLMDLHIKNEEDIKRYSDAPVLGHIPHYDATGQTTGYEYESETSDSSNDSEVMDR